MDLDEVQGRVSADMGDINAWCDGQYDITFKRYFDGLPELYEKFSNASERGKISDEDLEWVLTEVPLQLIAVSEELSKYKLNYECLKLHIRKLESDAAKNSTAKTVAQRKDDAFNEVVEYKILLNAYSSVISRVENQVNFSREFIMTAKKIWDSRSKTYSANPISPVDADLEDYKV